MVYKMIVIIEKCPVLLEFSTAEEYRIARLNLGERHEVITVVPPKVSNTPHTLIYKGKELELSPDGLQSLLQYSFSKDISSLRAFRGNTEIVLDEKVVFRLELD